MFNVLDHLFTRDGSNNAASNGALGKMRIVLASVYDWNYSTSESMYGEANDTDDFGDAGAGRVDTPDEIQQFNPKRSMRPSSHTYTPQDENGFIGLDPPVG